MEKYIITFAREFGSRGREIAMKLGATLEIPVFDKEIIRRGAWRAGHIDEEYREADQVLEDKLNGLDTGKFSLRSENAKYLYKVQADAVKKLAEEAPCIFIGRCADYVLRDNPNCMNVFIYAPYSARYYHILNEYGFTEEVTKNMIDKVDRARHDYYKAVTGRNRGERDGKHLMVDSSMFGVEGTVAILEAMVKGKYLNENVPFTTSVDPWIMGGEDDDKDEAV